MRGRLAIVGGIIGVAVLVAVILLLEPSPVRIQFVGYTNHEGRTIALFGITNLLKHSLRGVAFAETNPTPPSVSGPHLATNQVVSFGPVGRMVTTTQVVWRATTVPITPERRDLWLGAVTNAPHNGMILGVRDPSLPWKLALFFPLDVGAFSNTPRARLAAFLQKRGWIKLGAWLQPAARPLIVYGPELPPR